MKKNGKSNGVSHFLEMYYMPIGYDAGFTYTLNDFPLGDAKNVVETDKPAIHLIGCSLKNSYDIDAIGGKYNVFARKYNDNYTANKEHCVYNFRYFCGKHGINLNTKESVRDIADAFMQAYSWAKKEKII